MKRLFIVFAVVLLASLSRLSPLTAQRPDSPTYGQQGRYAVGTRELRIDDPERPLSVTVWYPALNPDEAAQQTIYSEGILQVTGHALRDAEPDTSGGPYPILVFSHGNASTRFQSLYFTERLASYGFIVFAPDHPGNTILDAFFGGMSQEVVLTNFALRPLDILRVIDYAESLNTGDTPFAGLADLDNVAVAGHSFGGYTAFAVGGAQLDLTLVEERCAADPTPNLGCLVLENTEQLAELRGLDAVPQRLWPPTTDSRIKAVIAMAPANGPVFGETGLSGITAPTLILVGSEDRVTPAENNAFPAYEGMTAAPEKGLVVLNNAGHYVFVVDCAQFPENLVSLGFYDQCSDLVWDMDRAHDLINHFSIAFLLHTLKGDTAARAVLQSETEFLGVTFSAERP